MIFGVIFSIFGFLIFLSLILTNIDKAINSDGIFSGYTLQNSTLPNPVDLMLVFAQQVFPLDYILYTLLVNERKHEYFFYRAVINFIFRCCSYCHALCPVLLTLA